MTCAGSSIRRHYCMSVPLLVAGHSVDETVGHPCGTSGNGLRCAGTGAKEREGRRAGLRSLSVRGGARNFFACLFLKAWHASCQLPSCGWQGSSPHHLCSCTHTTLHIYTTSPYFALPAPGRRRPPATVRYQHHQHTSVLWAVACCMLHVGTQLAACPFAHMLWRALLLAWFGGPAEVKACPCR